MKIALVYLGRRGAGGKINYELGQNLAKRHRIRAFLSRDSEHLYLWENKPFEKSLFRTYRNPIQALFSLVIPFSLKRVVDEIRQFSPDVLLFPMFHPWNERIQKALRNIPSVVFIHDPRPHPDIIGWFYSQLEKESINYAMRCVVMSRKLIPELIERGVSKNKIDVIPLGIFSYVKNDHRKRVTELPKILFFGRIVSYKGLDVLLQAFKQVRRSISCQLLIVGKGNLAPYHSTIKSMSNIMVINRWVGESEIANYFEQCDLVVLPYTSATQSGVIPIAASFALPVIATVVGGLSEQIEHGVNGWLVEAGNVEALSNVIVEVLEKPKLAKRRGLALQEHYQKHFNWENIAHLLEDTLQKAQVT